MEQPVKGRKSPSRSKNDQLMLDDSKGDQAVTKTIIGEGQDQSGRKHRRIVVSLVLIGVVAITAIVVLSIVLTRGENKIPPSTSKTWGYRGDACEAEIANITAYVKRLTTEWEDMVVFKDAEAIVNRYTEDTVFINKVDGRIVRQHMGREELIKAYEEWFASGVIRSEVTPINEGWFDENHLYATIAAQSFDANATIVADVTQLILFQQVGCGFQTHMVVDIIDE